MTPLAKLRARTLRWRVGGGKGKPKAPKRTPAWDKDHDEAVVDNDHCPCWYNGKFCCICTGKKPVCKK